MFKKAIGRSSIIIVMHLTFLIFLVFTSLKGYSLDVSPEHGVNLRMQSSIGLVLVETHFDNQNLNALGNESVDVEEEVLTKKAKVGICFQLNLSDYSLVNFFSTTKSYANIKQPFIAELYYIKYCALKIPSS